MILFLFSIFNCQPSHFSPCSAAPACEILVGCYTIWPYFVIEHLGLALALNVPVFVVVTKIDMCPANVLQDTMKLLTRILKSPGCRKIPVIVQNPDDVVVSATNFVSER